MCNIKEEMEFVKSHNVGGWGLTHKFKYKIVMSDHSFLMYWSSKRSEQTIIDLNYLKPV